MNRASVLAIMASASVIAGSICLNAEGYRESDFIGEVLIVFVAGGLGLWAIIESYRQK